MGDGGLQYALAELGTAAQHGIAAKLLVVDDGGYGILREYQRDAFGETTSVELPASTWRRWREAFGVPVRSRHARGPRTSSWAGRWPSPGRPPSCCAPLIAAASPHAMSIATGR